MRRWAVFCFCATLCGAAFVQQCKPVTPDPPKPESQLEKRIVDFVFCGMSEGHADMLMTAAGDSTAVALTRMLAGRELSHDQIEFATIILRTGFSSPDRIVEQPDRKPRTTLFVLRYLDLCTKDPALKEEIAKARKEVMDQAAKLAKPGE